MSNQDEAVRLRRYLLGESPAEERDAVERAYFERADALDRVSEAEDELIDEYLSRRLGPYDRERFDRHYLATPTHRRRVAVARAIRNATATTAVQPFRAVTKWWWPAAGLAAASIVLVAGAAWMIAPRATTMLPASDAVSAPAAPTRSPASSAGDTRELREARQPSTARADAPRSTPTVVTLSISPILVRGADEPPTVTIEAGTETVRLLLDGTVGEPLLRRGRAIVRTVQGREVWRGPTQAARPALARVDIPAALLHRDDYLVDLRGMDAAGVDVERHQYFFRVRTR